MPRHCSKRAPRLLRALAALSCALLLACLPAAASADEDPGASRPTEPFGTQPQVTEDGRLFAWLYLPELPSHPELVALRVERAWIDEPDAWSPVYTFVWDDDWQEFSAIEDPFQTIRYHDYSTGNDTPCVDYFDPQTNGRSFLLRATADVAIGNTTATRLFAPVTFTVPGGQDPDEGAPDEGPSGGAADGGGTGGDKGGIGQGEHERPLIEPPSIPSADDDADEHAETGAPAAPLASAPEAGEGASSGLGGEAASKDETSLESPAPSGSASDEAPIPPAAEAGPGAEPATQAATPSRLPGAVLALGATAALAAAAALALRVVRARRG